MYCCIIVCKNCFLICLDFSEAEDACSAPEDSDLEQVQPVVRPTITIDHAAAQEIEPPEIPNFYDDIEIELNHYASSSDNNDEGRIPSGPTSQNSQPPPPTPSSGESSSNEDSSASVASPPQQRYRVRVRGGRTGVRGRGAVNNRRQNAGVCGTVGGRGQRRGAAGNRQQNFDYNFVWDDNARPFRVFPFTAIPGVKVNIDDSTCVNFQNIFD